MKNSTPKSNETKRTRRRFSELAPGVQKMALDNLVFHRDAEAVSRRFEVHQSTLLEAMLWKLYDQMRERPAGPANQMMILRRAA